MEEEDERERLEWLEDQRKRREARKGKQDLFAKAKRQRDRRMLQAESDKAARAMGMTTFLTLKEEADMDKQLEEER
jgi:hypothetical protein